MNQGVEKPKTKVLVTPEMKAIMSYFHDQIGRMSSDLREEIGLLRTAKRYAGGRRVFEADALQRLRFIARLKTLGFSLEEIRHLNEVFEVRRSTRAMLTVLDDLLGSHLETIDERLGELQALKKDIGRYRLRTRERMAALSGNGAAPSGG